MRKMMIFLPKMKFHLKLFFMIINTACVQAEKLAEYNQKNGVVVYIQRQGNNEENLTA